MSHMFPSWRVTAVAIALAATAAAPVAAQCVGDCDGTHTVSVDELVIGVNIALGTATLDRCSAFDRDMSKTVTVDELVAGVGNALNGCGTSPPTPTPTLTATPTTRPCVADLCGNGTVDFDCGETCDDGNTLEGDRCPANCRIAPCTASGAQITAHVDFAPPAGVDLAGLTVFLRYPDGVVKIPGTASDPQVQNRITDLPDGTFSTPNDLDYALRLAIFTPDSSAIPIGRLFSVQFDGCQGAAPPSAADFSCRVEQAADTNSNTVSGVTCTVTLQ
jgi:cysteine-rich repeat protein